MNATQKSIETVEEFTTIKFKCIISEYYTADTKIGRIEITKRWGNWWVTINNTSNESFSTYSHAKAFANAAVKAAN